MKNKKQKISLLKLLVFLLIPAVVGAAGTYQLLYSANGESSFELSESDGLRNVVKRIQDYEVYRRYSEHAGSEEFLVASSQRLEFFLNADGVTGEISWSVRGGQNFANRIWSQTEEATELNVHDGLPVLTTGLAGCCGSMTGYRLYDLETGRHLMPFNDFSFRNKVNQPFSIEVPNSHVPTRWVGVLSGDSTRDFNLKPNSPTHTPALLLHYVGGTKVQKLRVDVPKKEGYGISILSVSLEKDPAIKGSQKIQIIDNQIVMWNIDGQNDPQKIVGLILRIDMDWGDGTRSIKLPIRGDQIVTPVQMNNQIQLTLVNEPVVVGSRE